MERSRLGTRVARFGLLGIALGLGCASLSPGAVRYEFFATPRADDPWTPKIASWQSRERASLGTPAPASVSGPGGEDAEQPQLREAGLRRQYATFRAERKRILARELAGWIQQQARRHYVPDGPVDHWATLEETLARGGEDCDGLELLSYHFLRDLGFRDDEVFRAIVFRRSDGQHHMVTLWFEDSQDPWVIDPTGAMTTGMPRLSQVSEWLPLKVFSETEEFTPQRVAEPAQHLAAR
ncbi:MAG: hypothetical protein ABFS46_14475 [Myxococcota bacterium]